MKNPKIVILGGGFGGLYVARKLIKKLRKSEAQITLVDKRNFFLFTPLLHEVAASTIDERQPIDSISSLLGADNLDWIQDHVVRVEFENKKVVLKNGELVEFDYLVVALGSEPFYYGVEGAEEYAIPLKDLSHAVSIRNKLIQMFEEASRESDAKRRADMLNIVIVGGGPTGIELAGEIADFVYDITEDYFTDVQRSDVTLTLVHSGEELIPMAHEKLRKWSKLLLEVESWDVLLSTFVSQVDSEKVVLADGKSIRSNLTIWAGGVKPVDFETDLELKKDKTQRLLVDKNMRLLGHDNVFALGDIANGEGDNAWPMLAQAAVQSSKVVAKNLLKIVRGENDLDDFVFKSKGFLASMGKWRAIGDLNGIKVKGPMVWLLWHAIYVFKFISPIKRIKLIMEWIFHVFAKRDITRLENDV